MTGTTLNRRYRYYQCTNARKMADRPAKCVAKYVKADSLEKNVMEEVKLVLENPSVVVSEIRRRQAEASPYGAEGLKRIQREANELSRQEIRLLRLFRFGDINEKYLEEEIKDIRGRQATLEQEGKELDKNRQLLSTLGTVGEDIENICSLVRENLDELDYEGQRQALDAIAARVVVSPQGNVLYGHLPSYVTIARTSA